MMAYNQNGSFPLAEREEARLAALAQYGTVGSEPEQEYDHIVGLAADVFDAPMAALTLLDRDRQWLKARVGIDICETPRDISFCTHAVLSDEIFVVTDATKDSRFAENPLVTGECHLRFYAGAPLIAPSGFRLGTLCIIDVAPRSLLTDKEERTLRRLARMAMDLLEQRRLRSIKRGATSLLSATPSAIVCADARSGITVWNKGAERLFGYARAEAIGQPFNAIVPDRLRKAGSPGLDHLCGAEAAVPLGRTVEASGLHRSGREIPVEISFARWGEGDDAGVGVIVKDITERKKREASIRLLFEASPVPMWLYDVDSLRFLAVNETAISRYGYTQDAFLAMTLLDIRPASDHEALVEAVRAMDSEHRQERSSRHLRADGSVIEVLTFSHPMPYEGRRARLVAVIDVTERNRASEELRSTRRFLHTVVESIPATLFVKDAKDGRFLLINRAGEELLGLSRDDIIGKTSFDLFPRAQADHDAGRDREALQSGQVQTKEEAISTRHKGVRLLRTAKIAVADARGEPEYLIGIAEDLTERKYTQARLDSLTWFDQLTSLPNRASFDAAVSACLAQRQRTTVFVIGLDRFRQLNETLGHATGDELLKAVASRLLRCIDGTGMICRASGDEFAILLPGQDGEADAGASECVLGAFETPFWVAGQAVHARASIGIAVGPEHGASAADLVAAAELALHDAKGNGGRRHRVFQEAMRSSVQTRQRLEGELRRAIRENEFELFFQPQVSLEDRAVVGAEALIRWRHPERGLLAPAAFLPVLEASEFAATVGHWTIATAAAYLARLRAAGLPIVQMGVNLFAAQLRNADLASVVVNALASHALPPGAIELEITENIMLEEDEEAVAPLRALRDFGVAIAFDDYGTGFASLSLLKRFPLTRLKIDRSFVRELASDRDDAAIVKAVLRLGESLGLGVIAEGIETPEQERLLAELGCREGQGYLYGRPMPAADFETLLGRAKRVRRAA